MKVGLVAPVAPRLVRVGPVLGGSLAVPFAAGTLIRVLLDVPWEDAWLVGLGALCAGPPWIAYLVVVDRGRSGRQVALATPVWATATVVLAELALFALLRVL